MWNVAVYHIRRLGTRMENHYGNILFIYVKLIASVGPKSKIYLKTFCILYKNYAVIHHNNINAYEMLQILYSMLCG